MRLNARFLAACLREVGTEKLHMVVSGSLTPVIIKPTDDSGFIAVLMPMTEV